jgi:hypothetical protein
MIRSREVKAMKKGTAITCVFLDIGQALLSTGWEHHTRKRSATHFMLEWAAMGDRNTLTFPTYEEEKLTLEEYLDQVVFYQKPPFTRHQLRRLSTGIDQRSDLDLPNRFDVHDRMAKNWIGMGCLNMPEHLLPGVLVDSVGRKTGGHE